MIYFDNAATSHPKPPEVGEAVLRAINSFGNSSRGAHAFALSASRETEQARRRAAALFGCRNTENVAFCKNVTEALNLAVNAVKDHIITSEAEHNSVLRPVFRRGNFSLIETDAKGCFDVAAVARQLRPDTGAVVLAHASNLTGNVIPLTEIAALCRERGVALIIDAAQTAGLLDIDMDALGIDALCFTGHKALYGPQGTGGICLGDRFRPEPLIVGGTGSRSFETFQPEEMPDRLEAGTQNSHGIAGLSAGLEYVRKNSAARLLAMADELARRFYRGVCGLPGVTLYGDYEATVRVPIVTLNLGNLDAEEVADTLAYEHGIAVRAGVHCAPLLHRRFGTGNRGAVRFSFSHFNNAVEVDTALRALGDMA